MGCCFSRSAGPNSPYPGGAPSSSSRAINPAPLDLPDAAQQNAQAQDRPAPSRRRRQQIPLDQKINRPLKLHKWTSDKTWTRRELNDEREAFFDTRVTGRQEVWQTIHAALRALWESEDGRRLEGFDLAKSILSAGDILLPTGNLANGVYDAFGNYYPLPEYIVCDPTNMASDDDVKTELPNNAEGSPEDNDLEGDAERSEKGKSVVVAREHVALRVRLSENSRDYNVSVTTNESIRSVAKKVVMEAELPAGKKVRLAYMGKLLKDTATLEAHSWQPGHTVNALVFDE